MEAFKRFRRLAMLAAALSAAALSAGALAFDTTLAAGIAAGGIAGILGFYTLSRDVARLAGYTPPEAQRILRVRAAARYVLYAAALIWARWLDVDSMSGLLGAVIGIFVMRTILLVLGITGLASGHRRER